MASRRLFLHQSFVLGASGLLIGSIAGCAGTPGAGQPAPGNTTGAAANPSMTPAARRRPPPSISANGPDAPSDIFDAATLDLDFWIRPRTISVRRQATGEKAELLYWKDGEMVDAAYRQLCHLLRDVQANVTAPIDPKLIEILWATQAFVARFGITSPLEILSGYRTPETNRGLSEQGVPAARKSLHMEGRAADIRIPNLDAGVLGGLISSFRQGGVGFYYRQSKQGGWIHADTGLQRSWKG
ncbi:MAG: DUF882 domain-containing protein [Pseudomonadota bacterium]